MENLRLRVDIQLKTYWDGRYGAKKCIESNFKRFTVFDENLVAIELQRTHILMNKPIAFGMGVLDLSKLLMHNFFYNDVKVRYGEEARMLYTDTDSFILEINTDCVYSDMQQYLEKFDTSGYAEKNRFNMPRVNKMLPGLFKDELNGQIILEFVGLRSKMYCVRSYDVEQPGMKKAKGVKKYVLKKQ